MNILEEITFPNLYIPERLKEWKWMGALEIAPIDKRNCWKSFSPPLPLFKLTGNALGNVRICLHRGRVKPLPCNNQAPCVSRAWTDGRTGWPRGWFGTSFANSSPLSMSEKLRTLASHVFCLAFEILRFDSVVWSSSRIIIRGKPCLAWQALKPEQGRITLTWTQLQRTFWSLCCLCLWDVLSGISSALLHVWASSVCVCVCGGWCVPFRD